MSDDWERIYTPHRMVYLRGGKKPKTTEAGEDCPFCIAPDLPEEEGLVFARGEHVYGVLNLYPYNSGHVMICPYRHIAEYPEIDHAEMVELGEFTQRTMRILRKVATAQGFNVGMNQGSLSGAGIAGHLHQHIVPRWGGDTNFMPIIGQTKVIPQLLEDTRKLLAQAWIDGVGLTDEEDA
jgi:ATP adenylyltransferase